MAGKESGSGEGSEARKVKRRGGRRDLEALRDRRTRAAEMFAAGRRQVDVAAELEVSPQTASRWYRQWTEGGNEALEGAGRAELRPRFDDGQIEVIREELLKGPQANGFTTGVWTLGRVAIVIERLTGVTYGPTQTWTILRTRLGWSRQRPARRAVERDEDAIVAWRENEWPRIKK
ncbi:MULTISPECIES: winged helix-turn-helix domain-containing protein [unclassified Rhodococcus (in: high G+C Gram-positive bacteria)]|uniref:winged helix-turn-helix domain-containing protein n=1 Tax=unclassified Rhodococcus (in: high G+C Gram-positive bacteria) TaxID=192944 RepID=UPI00163A698E|nr:MULTISPECIES: winged helix-turn-helix domain-containing protein [unclassified Rhodococcus (in: high G+C Gram-positive bacteria)]MBC2637587.1 winged helix-turn-helix domain-containing protein [Rhodococcus sp. 3A]MBC2644276.1 winged helix-turn-helix domain-containing protein [Rhodococcus sp. 3A]MBC2890987.1 winged helix-turn-helix domain-containing protein [Rhodococcus sp. 4CII]MBC2897668.1 winged helix-turn-helix domain-containing protein [Rhodococcus sp. 4CII]